MRESFIQMVAISFIRKQWEESSQSAFHVADESDLDVCATADLFAADVDLDYCGLLRIKLTIREVRPEHQEDIRTHDRVLSGRKSEKPRHADIIRIVVFDEFLASKCEHGWSFQLLCSSDEFLVGSFAARPSENRDFLSIVKSICGSL